MRRRVSLSLVLLMLLQLFIFSGCGSKDGPGSNVTGDYEIIDAVPEGLDFEGQTFTVLCREDDVAVQFMYEIEADESSSDVVNQAVYERNLAVEERLNIDYKAYPISGNYETKDDFINTFRNSILAGDGAFDLIMSQAAYMSELGLSDLFCNWREIPYVKDDLDSPYFYQDEIKELTYNGKLFYMLSDYHLTFWDCLFVLFFDKKVAQNENIDDLYQLVKDNKWTVDKMLEISKGLYRDLNGNGYYDENDQFAYISGYANTTDAFYSQFDLQPTSRDGDGNIVMDVDVGKFHSVLEKMVPFYQSEDVYAYEPSTLDSFDKIIFNSIFMEDRTLFYAASLKNAKKFRSMETDFGIIPYPMWDTNQQGYYTQAQDWYSIAVVPIDVKNKELCGAAYDILASYSYQKVLPAYYDVALKNKYARDDDSAEMLDIIRDGAKINFGYFYTKPLGFANNMRTLIAQGNTNFVSYYESNKRGYERSLKTILKTYE